MKRRENMMLQKGVTMYYMTESQLAVAKKQAGNKSSSQNKSNNNNYGGGGIYIPVVNNGQAGSMGPSFTNVDWRKTQFGQ